MYLNRFLFSKHEICNQHNHNLLVEVIIHQQPTMKIIEFYFGVCGLVGFPLPDLIDRCLSIVGRATCCSSVVF